MLIMLADFLDGLLLYTASLNDLNGGRLVIPNAAANGLAKLLTHWSDYD